MFQLEVLIPVVLGGLFYAGLDAFLGKRLRWVPQSTAHVVDKHAIDLASLRSSLAATAGEDLATQLASLDDLQKRLESNNPADATSLVSSLRAVVERASLLVRSSQDQIIAVNSRISRDLAPIQAELDRDPAGLSAQSWFPAGNGHEPARENELRSAPRFPFPHVQQISTAADDGVPDQAHFFEVQFRDISTNGFSFYLPQRLTARRIIARLGIEPKTMLVLARIVHQTEVPTSDGATFRVGCQIVRRVLC